MTHYIDASADRLTEREAEMVVAALNRRFDGPAATPATLHYWALDAAIESAVAVRDATHPRFRPALESAIAKLRAEREERESRAEREADG